jgi:cell division protein FtsA
MIRNISVGIDIGSATTRVVVGEFLKGEKNPRVIGIGESETRGVRHGYIVSISDAAMSLKGALLSAEKVSGIKIKRAFVSIGGITLRSEITSGTAVISKADGEVTSLDINKALEEAEGNLNLSNKKVIQVFPLSFRLDSKEVMGRPEGMRGIKLEAKSLFITSSISHWEDLIEVIAEAGIDPINIIASPIAAANIALSEKQKIVGSALVGIGAETVTLVVFENGLPISLHTFPIGSSDITNDIALGLRIPLEKADGLKLGIISSDYSNYPKKKLDEIIEARLTDIFELIENHLKKIKRNELLPAGIIFVGGGSSAEKLEELSKNVLKLPSKIGTTELFGTTKTKLRDPAWFVALGLITKEKDNEGYSDSSIQNFWKDIKTLLKSMVKQLMP